MASGDDKIMGGNLQAVMWSSPYAFDFELWTWTQACQFNGLSLYSGLGFVGLVVLL